MSEQQQSNTLGKASLGLGVASISLVFGIGFCALVGAQQGWLALAGTPLLVCGVSSAFLGLIGMLLGLGGLIGNRPKQTAAVGFILSLFGICLFFAVLAALGSG